MARLYILSLLVSSALGFAPAGPVALRRSIATPRFLFGGADEKPIEAAAPPGAAPGMTPAQQAAMEEEMAMAMQYRDKMAKRLGEARCEGSSGGVTVVYSGEQVPLEVTVSDSAMAGGAAKVAEAAVEAAKKAQAEAQKTMQATMADMQKELMAELQAQAKK
mmetsp:Transcript_15596/g.36297  ORF Transcript_15596/g.36297 Transcript_15596/m.36297 type:complete len:162 (-) Transcript_15596:170-655(-)